MLKRLDLVGFKSFADKTRFDFPAGITAIVGPNGSGKSNIVDAVRWVLGEQSAKSLRGDEMADVIFNGSASRRGLGLAEVSLTLDNSRRSLAVEDTEVQITRRVYRSGEGEYLINQQPCRLRDIKELFLGSGAGADAYCVIEQGRVDVLLQSSTRDRRTIFEEAAGISRFKAKKTETLRKLERVDQNLQRLRDITDEVDRQLRSVKLQASKAQRYQEYQGRLRDLRIALGLREYGQLAGQLAAEEAALAALREGLAQGAARADSSESRARRLEEELARLDQAVHQQETALAHARQQIAAAEATQNHEWALAADLDTDLAATRVRLTELNARVGALAEAAENAAREVQGAEAEAAGQRDQVRGLEEALALAGRRLGELQSKVQADKGIHLEAMRQTARLQNDAVSHKAQLDTLRRECDRLRLRGEQAAGHLATVDLELEELARADAALQARLADARQAQADHREQTAALRRRHEEAGQSLAELRAQRSGLASRTDVLEALERAREGLGTGVREILDLLARPEAGPWQTVIGMVAELLRVQREYAPLIDLALGERAQRFVVRDPAVLREALRQLCRPLCGRVGFVPLAISAPRDPLAPVGLQTPKGDVSASPASDLAADEPGIVAIAERLVNAIRPELEGLPAQLLTGTLIVADLDAARRLASRWHGYRMITLQGEILEPDGTLTVGTQHSESGILSRKSELRDLQEQAGRLEEAVAGAERREAELRTQLGDAEARDRQLQHHLDILAEQAADLRTRLGQHRERRQGLQEEVTLSRREMGNAEQEMAGLEAAWQRAGTLAEEAERQVQALHARLEEADQEIRRREQERHHHQQEVTAAKVGLAKLEERLAGLRARHRQTQADLDQRRRERAQGEQHLAGARARLEESQRTMLEASAALAHWYVQKESAERRVVELAQERDRTSAQRQELAGEARAARGHWQAMQEQAHAQELTVSELRHRRETLVGRLHEDYQVDLAALHGRGPSTAASTGSGTASGERALVPPAEGAPDDPAAAQEEIEELKRKLNRLGSVNLDSLQELADLEGRAATLHTQTEDLVAGKRALEEIIGTINQDSRRLFGETFRAIRTHFQELFRKLFGGGMADIVLEDENDPLESGIEIIARPPGKELRSISLMSGGEKTLTAVALLLAIFRSRPSPFCILDEVDAALDEANIARYTAVLREFLDRSQFIIITHSKKTMAGADVLYGITMQESGISKQVAVRFEDWPDDEAASEAPSSSVA